MKILNRLAVASSLLIVQPSAHALEAVYSGRQLAQPPAEIFTPLSGIIAIAGGDGHSLALREDGTVVGWGANYSGQATAPDGLTGVTEIASGSAHNLALRSDGTVLAWGNNSSGQTNVPAGLIGVTSITAGGSFSAALKNDGTVVAWGQNNFGQATVPAGLGNVTAIAAGNTHALALLENGTVVAWGNNNSQQTSVPAGLDEVTAIAAGGYHSIALKQDGTAITWGQNLSGQTDVPATLAGVTAIAAGYEHTVALKNDGTVLAWGAGGEGSFYDMGQISVPSGLSGVTVIAAGGYHSLAIGADGMVFGWGGDENMFFFGYNDGQGVVPGTLRGVISVAAGYSHTAALKDDGTVAAWEAPPGPFGMGHGLADVPEGLTDVMAISAGDHHTVALKSDGTVVAWGADYDDQTAVPAGLNGVTRIAAHSGHTLALRNDGTVVGWGHNSGGVLNVPPGLMGVAGIATGASHAIALKDDRTVVTWGANHYGQTTIPAGLADVIAVAAGSQHTMALKDDGTVVAWGENFSNQIDVPPGLSDVIAIFAGSSHSVALKGDGTVVAWGANWYGQTDIPVGVRNPVGIHAGPGITFYLSEPPHEPIVIDGILDAGYGAPLAVQQHDADVTDIFGNPVYLSNLYASQDGNVVNLFMGGHFGDGMAVLLFIDSEPGGFETIPPNAITAGFETAKINNLAGLRFENGFTADHVVRIDGRSSAAVDLYSLAEGRRRYIGFSDYLFYGGATGDPDEAVIQAATQRDFMFPDGMAFSAPFVTYGTEMSLDLDLLGVPMGDQTIKFLAVLVDRDSNVGSNQALAPLGFPWAMGNMKLFDFGFEPGVQAVSFDVSRPPDEITYFLDISSGTGGSTSPASDWKPDGAVIPISATAAPGYRFDRWIGDVADPDSPSTSVSMSEARTVQAQFIKTWTLTVDSFPQGGGVVTGGGVHDEGTQVTIQALANANYAFSGWQPEGVANSASATTTVNMDQDRQVTATFVLQTPDLHVLNVEIPAVGTSGQPLHVRWQVENQGNTATSVAQWTDQIILSEDQIIGNADDRVLANQVRQGVLHPSGSYQADAFVDLPERLPGTFWIAVVTDAFNTVVEIDAEGNNVGISPAPINVAVTDYADLGITDLSAPASATVGSQITVRWTVQNSPQAGMATPPGGWVERVYLSTDDIPGNGDEILLGSFNQNSALGVGESRTMLKSILLPGMSAGTYHLYVVTDAEDSIYEYLYENNNTSAVVPIEIDGPDLVVAEVHPAASVTAGAPFTVSWTLRNNGPVAASGQWQDEVLLSTDQLLGEDRVLGRFSFSGAIPPGGSVTRTQTVNAPSGIEGGHFVIVHANVNGGLPETDYTNNVGASTDTILIQPRPYPDLQAHGVGTPANVFSGQETEVSWSVTNSGTTDTGSSEWRDSIYLSDDDQLGNDHFLGSRSNLAALDVGEGYSNSLSVTIPRRLSGTYYLIVVANGNGRLDEGGATANNAGVSQAFPITLSPPPDLQVENVQAPAEAFSGQPVQITWRGVNAGAGPTVDTRWVDRVYLSSDTVLDGNDHLLGQRQHSGELQPSDSYEASLTVTLPQAMTGEFYFIVDSDAANEVFEHGFEGNNDGHDPLPTLVTLTPPPDLEVVEIGAVDDTAHGGILDIQYTVENRGASPTPNLSWTDAIFLSNGDVFNPETDRRLATYRHSGALDLSGRYTANISVQLPSGIWGERKLFIFADDRDTVFELDNANNILATPLNILEPADLTGSIIALPSELNSGGTLSFSFLTGNTGPSATTEELWHYEVYLSTDPDHDPATDTLIGEWMHEGSLAAGATAEQNLALAIPPTLAGAHYLIVKVDSKAAVTESDKTNNIVVSGTPLLVADAADLIPSGVVVQASALSGETIPLAYLLANQGGSPTGDTPWVDAVFLSTDAIFDPEVDQLIAEFTRDQALAGSTSVMQNELITIPYPLDGEFHLFVTTDFNMEVDEGDESNNTAPAPALLQVTLPQVDLVASDLHYPASAEGGESILFSWATRNDSPGILPSLATWSDAIYLSAEPQFDPGTDVLIGTSSRSGPLAPGADVWHSVALEIPYGLSGTYHVFLVSDHAGQIAESNELNNVLLGAGTIQLDSNPPDLVLSGVRVPDTAVSGSIILLDWSVVNQGQGTTRSGGWLDAVTLSSDTIIGNEDDLVLVEVPFEGDLDVGQSYQRKGIQVILPEDLEAGTYHLFIHTDAAQDVNENGMLGNNSSGSIPIAISLPAVDLTADPISVPATARGGDSLPVDLTVRNIGQNRTRATWWRNEFYLSLDSELDPGDLLVGRGFHSGALDPGAQQATITDLRLPHGLTGEFHLIVKIDSTGRVRDGNRANNQVASVGRILLTAAPGADLVPTEIIAPTGMLTAGQEIQVHWSVANQGDAVNAEWFDSLYLSLDESLDPGLDIPLGSVLVAQSLPKDATYDAQATVRLPAHLSGTYRILVRTDSNNRVFEGIGESNNTAASAPFTIMVPPPGDLVVAAVETPGTSFGVGEMIDLAATILNQAASAVSGSWTDRFFLSLDKVWGFTDTLIGSTHFNGVVNAWESYTANLNTQIPGVLPGEYYVIVRSDIRNEVREIDDFNNEGTSLGTITVTIPELLIDVPETVALPEGSAVYYKITVPAGETMVISLVSDDPDAVNELHVSHESMPSRSNADFASTGAIHADQQVIVPQTVEGNYYVMAYARNASTSQAAIINARIAGFEIIESRPNVVGNTGTATIELRGSEFEDDTIFILKSLDGSEVARIELLNERAILDQSRATVTLPVGNIPIGSYTIHAASGEDLTDGIPLDVVDGSGRLGWEIVHPDSARPGSIQEVAVRFWNSGLCDVDAPSFVVERTDGGLIHLRGFAELARQNQVVIGFGGGAFAGRISPGELRTIHLGVPVGTKSPELVLTGIPDLETVFPWDEYFQQFDPTAANSTRLKDIAKQHVGQSWGDVLDHVRNSANRMNIDDPGVDLFSIVSYLLYVAELGASEINNNQSTFAAKSSVVKALCSSTTQYFLDYERFCLIKPRCGFKPDKHIRFHDECGNLVESLDPKKDIVLVIHGWNNDKRGSIDDTDWMNEVGSAVKARNPDSQIVTVRWGPGADRILPWSASYNIGLVADRVAEFLMSATNYQFDPGKTDVIGYSLGAYIANEIPKRFDRNLRSGYFLDPATTLALDKTKVSSGNFSKNFDYSQSIYTSEIVSRISPSADANIAVDGGFLLVEQEDAHGHSIDWLVEQTNKGSKFGWGNQIPEEERRNDRFTFLISGDTEQKGQWRLNPLLVEKRSNSIHNFTASVVEGVTDAVEVLDYALRGDGLRDGVRGVWAIGMTAKYGPLWRYRGQIELIQSHDPNDILGPSGFGNENWIPADRPLSYTIRFENDPVFATAAAQVVRITQKLDSDLDPRSFRLGSFGFSGRVFEIPANRSFYQTRIDLSEEEGFLLDVFATIDIRTGVARWSFSTIDPDTGELTNDALAGFLPVNIEAPEGDGFVSYTIRANDGVPSGTVIDALASIVFDNNEPIDTPPIFHTVDAEAPTSTVTEVSGDPGETVFMVKWEGRDEPTGSALASYDVYSARDGGDFELWLGATTLTEAPFAGELGVGYSFYSVAIDNAGNRQDTPADAQGSIDIGGDVTLSLAADPAIGGSVSGAGDFPYGSLVPVTAIPSAGYRFDGWQGITSGEVNDGSTTITMNGTRSLTARFVKVWQLVAAASPVDGGSVTGHGTVDDGTNAPIRAIPAEGFLFHHWQGAVQDPGDESTTIPMDQNREIAAVFIMNPYLDYDAWAREKFLRNSGNPLIAGREADPDGDGVSNFMEFALGLDPNQPGEAPLGITRDPATGGLILSHNRLRNQSAVGYTLQVTDSLESADWTDLVPPPDSVSAAAINAWLERRQIRITPAANEPKQFFRLRIDESAAN